MIQDIHAFCKLFYSTTYIPISCFQEPCDPVCSSPDILQREDILHGELEKDIVFHHNVDYCITKSSGILGLVAIENTNLYIIIGPVFSVPISQQIIHDFLLEAHLPNTLHSELINILNQTPQISFHHFLHILAYLHLCLNDQVIDIREHFQIEDEELNEQIAQNHLNLSYLKKENRSFHNTVSFEKEMYNYIMEGDVERLEHLLIEQSHGLTSGTLTDNNIRQAKDILIGIITIASRCSLIGGLDAEASYTLADTYIFQCEHLSDITSIYQLQYNVLIDYARRVSANKLPDDTSPEIYRCIQFIKAHTNESIGLHDVAEYIHRSDSYTSRKFKEELGFHISAFIMRCKLEEAKSLLTYSDKSLYDISNYLCFSDQAYFQRVFKKQYGITPNNFRKQASKVSPTNPNHH